MVKFHIIGYLVVIGLFTAGCELFSKKSPFDLAVSGNIPMLKRLLDEGLDINQKFGYQGRTLIFGGVEREEPETVKFLIERGAEVNFRDKNEVTPLIHAIYYGNAKPIQLLLAHGARVNDKNKAGVTAFWRAVSQGETELAGTLIAHGADIQYRNKKGNTVLHVAAQAGDPGMVRLLLKHKAPVNVKNKKGFTPLYFPEEFSNRDISALLKKHGARLANPAPTPFHYKKTYQKLLGKGPLRVKRVIKHSGYNQQTTFSTKGDLVAQTFTRSQTHTADSENPSHAVQVWDVRTGKGKYAVMDLDSRPYGMRFAPDGRLFISSVTEPGVDIWDPAAGRKIRKIGKGEGKVLQVRAVASNRYLLVGESKQDFSDHDANLLDSFYPVFKELTGGMEHSLWLYDYQTGELVRELRGHRGEVLQAGFSSDGRYIASVSLRSFGEYADLRIWETGTGRPIRVQKNLGWVYRIAPFPRDRRLAATDGYRTLILDMETGQVIRQIREGGDHLGLLQDGRYMICLKYEKLLLIDVETGRVVQKANFRKEFKKLGSGYEAIESFTSLSVSPSGDTFLATTNHGKLIFFELKNS